MRAMGEAGIAEINEKDRKAREAAKHAASEALAAGGGAADGDESEADDF